MKVVHDIGYACMRVLHLREREGRDENKGAVAHTEFLACHRLLPHWFLAWILHLQCASRLRFVVTLHAITATS